MTHEDLLRATREAREAAWRSLGMVREDVLKPLVNPSLMGGPKWPSLRQAWREIRRDDRIALVSDGLSDPDEDGGAQNGFGLEFILETSDALGTGGIQRTWAFQAIYQLSQTAARHGGLRALLDDVGLATMEMEDVDAPAAFLHEGTAGLLLGVPAPALPDAIGLPEGDARLVTAKLLTAGELVHAIDGGPDGRRALAAKFAADGSHHVSSTARASVV